MKDFPAKEGLISHTDTTVTIPIEIYPYRFILGNYKNNPKIILNYRKIFRLRKKTVFKDQICLSSENDSNYQVTSDESGNVHVTYLKPVGDPSEITISNTVTLSDGTFAKVNAISPDAFPGNTTLKTKYLLEHVWRDEADAHEDTVWLYVSYLKRKLSLINSAMTISGEKGGDFKLCKGGLIGCCRRLSMFTSRGV